MNIGHALSVRRILSYALSFGLIRFLRDVELLTGVTHLASTSGGSVTAARLIYR